MSQPFNVETLTHIHDAAKNCYDTNYRVDQQAASLLGVAPDVFKAFAAAAKNSLGEEQLFVNYLWYLGYAQQQRRPDNKGNQTVSKEECFATIVCAATLAHEMKKAKAAEPITAP